MNRPDFIGQPRWPFVYVKGGRNGVLFRLASGHWRAANGRTVLTYRTCTPFAALSADLSTALPELLAPSSLRWLALSSVAMLGGLALSWRAYQGIRRQVLATDTDLALARAMLDHTPQLIGLLTPQGEVLRLNQAASDWLGPPPAALRGHPIWALPQWLDSHEDVERLRHAVARAATGRVQHVEISVRTRQGPRRVELSVRPMRRESDRRGDAANSHLLVEAHDVTLRRLAEDKMRLAAAVFEQAREGILITDPRGVVVSVNHAFSAITGFDADELIGQSPLMLTTALDDAGLPRRIRRALLRGGHWQGEVRSQRRNGQPFTAWLSMTRRRDADRRTTHLIAIVNDITHSKEAEQKLLRQAHFDALTELPNRHLLEDRLKVALASAQRQNDTLALLFIDLNQFRHINDNFGHRTGDGVLLEMAHRLRDNLRDTDVVARVGGDEFAVLLPATDAEGASQVAHKLLERVAQPCMVSQHELSLTLSIGIAMYPADGATADELTRCADTAMYRSKLEGRGTFQFFTPGMQQRSVRQLQLEAALRRAVERDELLLHYQPQLDARSGAVLGVEALVRWKHPELGMVSPGEFIPLAESSGQILAIGEWVLRTAVQQIQAWRADGVDDLVVAVNLSAIQFRDPGLPELVRSILEEARLAPRWLELELTESVATGNPTAAIAMMDRLHGLGVRLSIDDFGTGYSSLNYLKRFRIHTLKIDQSFVRDIGNDADDRAIVQAIIQMAHAMHLTTIAEGVETDEQASFLRSHGSDAMQGYRFCRPLEATAAQAWIQSRRAALQALDQPPVPM
jgi:diguanylate cyclase (GGDEF)-like protein/PAS domain S-box-containing protein